MRRLTLLALSTVSLGALVSAPAFAQTNPAPVTPGEAQVCANLPTEQERALCIQGQAQNEEGIAEAGDRSTMAPAEVAEQAAETGTIVVTGSRLRRNAFSGNDPLTVIDPELEQKAGRNDTAEILQGSPVAAGSFQITSLLSAGSFVTNGGVGAQTIGLRGLGPERTLVLVNGRRAGPAGTRGAIAGFDLNVIPSAAIESVEILKTGASSIYGSDAIAGVVNLLTRKSTDGLDIRAFGSLPFQSGGETYSVSATYGKQFSRGHFLVGADFTGRKELERGDRDYLLCPEEGIFNTAGDRADIIDPRTGEPRCNGFFGNALAVSTRALVQPPGSPQITFGTIQFNNPGDRLDEFLPPLQGVGLGMPPGFFPVSLTCPANATPAQFELCRTSIGLLDPIEPQVFSSTIQPKLNRYTLFADGSFDLTDSIQFVGEFLYNKRKTESDGARQLFFTQFTGATTLGNTNCTPARQAINPNCIPGTPGDPLNAGFTGNVFLTPVIAVATYAATEVDYYRGVGGIKADLDRFLPGWSFDSYVQYSRSDGDYTNSRIFQDSVRTQEFRTRACQPGQVTAVRGVPCIDIDFTDPRVLRGEFTPEESAFLFGNETGNTLYTQVTAEASVAGNLFSMPAGPVGVALGAQFRRDEIDDTPGEIALSQNVFGQSVSGRTAGFTRSKEFFGEIEVPLFRNAPLIQNMTFTGAARLTNSYAERDIDGVNDTDSGNWTYKLGLNWQVNDWLRFRGSYGTSFRSPALFEQFLADQTGFLGQAAIDPCVNFGQNVASGALPARVGDRCAALGISPTYNGGGTSSAVIATGGGIGVLDPETSAAKNFSVVLTPDRGLWDGMKFSVAVDYFDIEVKGQVTSLGSANIVFTCLNSDNYPDDPTCALFTRDLAPGSPRFGEITNVRDPFINIDTQRNRGVDLTARMTQDLGNLGKLSLLGQMTWQIEDLFELFQGFESDSNGTSGEPIWVGDFKATYAKGPWSLFYGLNVTGGTSDEQNLRDARGGDVCFNSPVRGGLICPIYRLKPQFYHAASLTRDFGKRFSVTAGVSNIFDTKPPMVSGAFGPISTIGRAPVFGTQYDLVGRRGFVSARAKF